MKILGYCQDCAATVEMADVKTVRLPNMSFIHRGRCTNIKGKKKEICNALIFKKIADTELILDEQGHKIPQVVYVSDETPKRIWQESKGQTIVTGDVVKFLESRNSKVLTVDQAKIELKIKRSVP